jgi:FKBP-type peptidyl-prolyl cis-trans isomerase FkpA
MSRITPLVLLIVLVTLSCRNDEDDCGLPDLEVRAECAPPSDRMGLLPLELMDLYVTEQGLNVTKSPDNLWYVITNPGSDEKPSVNDRVRVDYEGYFRNNCRFDGTSDISFRLTNLIEGWKLGIPLVGKCGTIKLILPPSLAYGSNPPPGIPRGEPLIFDINLLDF